MERGLEQLFIFAAILLAALIDLFVRGLKRRERKAQPAEVDEELVFVEEHDSELLERGRVGAQLPPATPSSVQLSRASSKPETPPRRPPQPPPSPGARRRRPHSRRWLKRPTDARRGIVLMTVLGPCRGLEMPRRDA